MPKNDEPFIFNQDGESVPSNNLQLNGDDSHFDIEKHFDPATLNRKRLEITDFDARVKKQLYVDQKCEADLSDPNITEEKETALIETRIILSATIWRRSKSLHTIMLEK